MKTRILIVMIVLSVGYMAFANPDSPGRSMMSALSGIQDAILSLTEPEVSAEKEWYHGRFQVAPAQNDSIFVVPAGQQFVLRRLYAHPTHNDATLWHLAANQTTILYGSINKYSFQTGTGSVIYKFQHDFPDNSVTINSDETLNVVNESGASLDITVIGYYQAMP